MLVFGCFGREGDKYVVSVEGGCVSSGFGFLDCRSAGSRFVCISGSESVCGGPAQNLSTSGDFTHAASNFRELVRDFAKTFAKPQSRACRFGEVSVSCELAATLHLRSALRRKTKMKKTLLAAAATFVI